MASNGDKRRARRLVVEMFPNWQKVNRQLGRWIDSDGNAGRDEMNDAARALRRQLDDLLEVIV